MTVRRGGRRLGDVTAEVIQRLEAGEPSVNHIEQMAIDMGALWTATFPHLADQASQLRGPHFLDRMRSGGQLLWQHYRSASVHVSRASKSDTVRGWGAFALSFSGMSASEQLEFVVPFAADDHFAVREWAWLSARPAVAKELKSSLPRLAELAQNPDPFVRRFSCEVVRPRGVWSAHIPALKETPDLALPVLEALVADEHRYVQDSVANWLNDAAKSSPEWVLRHVERWTAQFGEDIRYVRKRALRTIDRPRHLVMIPPAANQASSA